MQDEGRFLPPKKQSRFCLEPEGDSPERKSIYDSVLSGCVPVLFSKWTDQIAPVSLRGWWQDARVLIEDPSEFFSDREDQLDIVNVRLSGF